MIITEQKPFEKILQALQGEEKIFLIGCGECAATCKTGGEPEILEAKGKLEKSGKKVTGWVVPDAPCITAQTKAAFAKNIKAAKEADSILVLACGSGVQTVKESERFKKPIHPGLDTVFLGSIDKYGNFYEYCSACGDCILEETNCICPVTRCPKGLMDGPCGGVEEGKCEVDRDKDCVWVLIYKELSERKKLDLMRKIQPPKDYSKAQKPRLRIIFPEAEEKPKKPPVPA